MLAYIQTAPISDPVGTRHIPPPLNSNIWCIIIEKKKDGHVTAQFFYGFDRAAWLYDSNNSFVAFRGREIEKNWLNRID